MKENIFKVLKILDSDENELEQKWVLRGRRKGHRVLKHISSGNEESADEAMDS